MRSLSFGSNILLSIIWKKKKSFTAFRVLLQLSLVIDKNMAYKGVHNINCLTYVLTRRPQQVAKADRSDRCGQEPGLPLRDHHRRRRGGGQAGSAPPGTGHLAPTLWVAPDSPFWCTLKQTYTFIFLRHLNFKGIKHTFKWLCIFISSEISLKQQAPNNKLSKNDPHNVKIVLFLNK